MQAYAPSKCCLMQYNKITSLKTKFKHESRLRFEIWGEAILNFSMAFDMLQWSQNIFKKINLLSNIESIATKEHYDRIRALLSILFFQFHRLHSLITTYLNAPLGTVWRFLFSSTHTIHNHFSPIKSSYGIWLGL